MEIHMMSLSKFTGGGGTPLRSTTLTASTGTFTPLTDTTWFYLTMIGAGGAGGSSAGNLTSSSGSTYNVYGSGGRGGSCGQLVTKWYQRESVSGTPISSYTYTCGSYSAFNTVWNTGSAGTLGQLYALGGQNGGNGSKTVQGSNGYWYTDQPMQGESCLFGTGGSAGGGTAQGYGAGGGGGSTGLPLSSYDTYVYNAGGSGALGLIIVVEY